jgi:hypothetical protein
LIELKTLLDMVCEFFNALCFSEYCSPWFWTYLDDARHSGKTDIQMLLDLVARTSPLLNLPEQEPEFWVFERAELTQDEIRTLNHYRRKFGLPEVD